MNKADDAIRPLISVNDMAIPGFKWRVGESTHRWRFRTYRHGHWMEGLGVNPAEIPRIPPPFPLFPFSPFPLFPFSPFPLLLILPSLLLLPSNPPILFPYPLSSFISQQPSTYSTYLLRFTRLDLI